MHCTTLLLCKIDADQNANLFTSFKIDCRDLLIKLLMNIDPSPVCLSSRACLTAALAGSHGHVECIAYHLIKGMNVDDFLKQMKEDTHSVAASPLATTASGSTTPLSKIDNDSAYDDDSIPLDDNELDELAAVPDIATCLAQLKEPASQTSQDHINGTVVAIRWLRQALASDTPYDLQSSWSVDSRGRPRRRHVQSPAQRRSGDLQVSLHQWHGHCRSMASRGPRVRRVVWFRTAPGVSDDHDAPRPPDGRTPARGQPSQH